MTELYWPRRAVFTDYSGAETTDYSEGVHDVPEEKVDQYLDRGWQKPEDSETESTAPVPSDGADEPSAGDQELDEDELALDPDGFGSDTEGDSPDPAPEESIDAEPETADADEPFDAESFVDRNVGPVENDILSGEYDAHLDAIERAEDENRDRVTVRNAIAERIGTIE